MIMKDDIQLRAIMRWVVILTATAVGSMIFCAIWQGGLAFLKHQYLDGSKSPLAPSNYLPPEPRLQPDPTSDMVTFRLQEENLLNTYGWIDQPEGVVRLPIDRAIELTAKELK